MGFWGIVFAVVFIPTIVLCLSVKDYRILGTIMFFNWLAYIIPVRGLLNLGDGPFYFVFISTLTAVAIYLFTFQLRTARIVMACIALLLVGGYFPYYLNLINLHQTMIIADIIGFIQILAMIGGSGGSLARGTFRTRDISRRNTDMETGEI